MKQETLDNVKLLIAEYIDTHSKEIIELGTMIYRQPELGFKEYKTAEVIISFLKEMSKEKNDIEIQTQLSVTGVKAKIGDGKVNICLLAEMDAIPTRGHPYASDDQSAAHACGHSNQTAIMLYAFKALYEAEIPQKYGVSITFISTPAEEYIDLDYRKKLRDSGKIQYLSGKQDMIVNGVFDDVDIVLSCHSIGGAEGKVANVNSSLAGFLSKQVIYRGRISHAGAAPELGVNALNAAMIGLNAVHVQRETFKDEHNVRVHGIITNGGHTVNSVPDYVEMELMVRGSDVNAILDANKKVNRALEAGAYAVGAKCEISDGVGYLPFYQNEMISAVLKENMSKFIPVEDIEDGGKCMASGDIGDLGSIKPSVQLGFGGFAGNIHGADFKIVDEDMAYIIPAKAIAMSVCDLADNKGKLTAHIVDNSSMIYTKEEYVKIWLGKEIS